ncbi:MAG: DASS family sodium-coupled anion symporter [Desulfobacterales bacterium]|nr:DASS family sodium-coupled anion symporter [Desulfobacterales bacterium]
MEVKPVRVVIMLVFLAILWFIPPPWGITVQAWHLFSIFITAILAVVIGANPILTTAIIAAVVAIFLGVLDPVKAYSGFGKGFILLIVVAFLVANGVIKSGLGNRIAYMLVSKFGKSTLRLGYCMVLTDAVIAPAFPSNTARSGVLYPITLALARGSGSKVEDGTQKKMGSYLMMNCIAGITLSSTLWFTGMAANPVGAKMAADAGVEGINFGSWFMAASVPTFLALIIVPFLLYKLFAPEVKETPEAPKAAAEELKKMGPMSRDEWITGLTFLLMVVLWALSGTLGVDKTAVAFGGLAVLMVAGIFTLADLKNQGDALGTFIWFSILYTMSSQLNELGFMKAVGNQLALGLQGMSWPVVYVSIVVLYVLLHYVFVSQTAQMLALYTVFLGVSVQSGVPPMLMALMLLFATNFFAAITPQGSSANVLCAGSGYLTQGDMYRMGGMVTLVNLLIFLIIGTPWILLVVM